MNPLLANVKSTTLGTYKTSLAFQPLHLLNAVSHPQRATMTCNEHAREWFGVGFVVGLAAATIIGGILL